ncbi:MULTISPECIES: FecCD family ABC transporter permease [Pseudomonas]|uniref:Siderophore achromobactin ABC transporter, permease protein n=1 Tax=Pseudomonas chlororaphis subsp. aureofaciens TaxID=587851 RepID=A0AAD0ZJF8_9PSED|nr:MULTISPECIES: iron ABC transporter permease [Pseudomonas]AIC20291.1 iron ABC transporter permease [Pseudomonas chlororaphis]AZD99180.1 Siderophore achromobactin ABC transporter, permease protein [Pseudomonas chlororaphis subsp. aureofaciens]AZE05364.1 Siderophore achromobactin ABC transporter, permease protein [Pseudomonas chlororaphis subsp. aureofaciens]AZE30027.1 Siderophore achromobactin ABC transporter, permease protein [Pseudomonas chlororaphis subsp. aureofaciens]MBP5064523.1 iron AB
MSKTLTLRSAGFSRRIDLATLWRLSLALLATALVMLGALSLGKLKLSPLTVLELLWHGGDERLLFIVEQLRLPRLLLAALVGAALAVSGLILQSIIRNPLASPDLLGITSGASAAAVLYLSFFSLLLGPQFLPLAAMLGAGLAALAIYLLAWKQGTSPLRLVLIGVGVSALLAAVTTFVLVFSPLTTTLSAYVWLTGSVYGASWPEPRALGGWLLAILPLLVWLARQVRVQQLDDALAQGIGVRVQWLRAGLLLVSVALAGAAVAWGGAIAFVGLIAPHIAKRLVAPGFAGQAVMAALVGANLVMLADLIGRTLFLPLDLPAGIFVAVLGTPFFLYLLINQRH